ncbi:hypothetical protein AWB69_04006 [Caballeronia udeis]|uniref:Uncharacterized protein n=1 Tax=Caballeronia udeis TaxID=1232866 RepID=A0A158H6Q6_9BURK|nr:hypothetical protein AWB69_04006 [Caballeronia udeis]
MRPHRGYVVWSQPVRNTNLGCEPTPMLDSPEHGVVLGWNPDPEANHSDL